VNATATVIWIQNAFDGKLDSSGVEILAIVEFDPLQLELPDSC
jgi:hypothetical protein